MRDCTPKSGVGPRGVYRLQAVDKLSARWTLFFCLSFHSNKEREANNIVSARCCCIIYHSRSLWNYRDCPPRPRATREDCSSPMPRFIFRI